MKLSAVVIFAGFYYRIDWFEKENMKFVQQINVLWQLLRIRCSSCHIRKPEIGRVVQSTVKPKNVHPLDLTILTRDLVEYQIHRGM